MKIRRFEAEDAKTALNMVKKEMGSSAVILATKTIAGKTGGRGRARVEVMAAMDYELEDLTAPQERLATSPATAYGMPTAPLPAPPPLSKPVPAGSRLQLEAQELKKQFGRLLHEKQPTGAVAATPEKRAKIQRPSPHQVAQWRDQIISQIKVNPLETVDNAQGPLTIALVGATGVGKTTTIAKLAAWFTLRQRKKVALISMDCYRIGATDQLRTYARIMRIPCEVTLEKENLAQAVARHADKDVILIDTAGKSPYDQDHVNELAEWFAPCGVIAPYLVISAAAQKETHTKVFNAYARLGIKGLIITKLDETRAYAALCQEVANAGLPVAGLATGQRVPEDFQMASKPWLEKLFNEGWAAVTPEANAAGQ